MKGKNKVCTFTSYSPSKLPWRYDETGSKCVALKAVLAFSRSFLFTAASIQLIPVLLGGVTGVWLAIPAANC